MNLENLKTNNSVFGTKILHSKTFRKFLSENPAKVSEYRFYHNMLANNGKGDTLVLSAVFENKKPKTLTASVYEMRNNKLYEGKYDNSDLYGVDTSYGMYCPNFVDLYERACNNMSVVKSNS